MSEGVDFATSRPSPALLRAAGKSFLGRYLDNPGGKGLTTAELHSYLNAGLGVYLIKEGTGQETKAGGPQGAKDGASARALLAGLGLPADTLVYYAVDYDVTTQLGLIDQYLNAARAAQGATRIGVYGEFEVIEHCVGSTATHGFQTYAWSGGKVSGKANVLQYLNGQNLGGSSVDLNRSLQADIGALGQNGFGVSLASDPAPATVSTHTAALLEATMANSDAYTLYHRPTGQYFLAGAGKYLAVGAEFTKNTGLDGAVVVGDLSKDGVQVKELDAPTYDQLNVIYAALAGTTAAAA